VEAQLRRYADAAGINLDQTQIDALSAYARLIAKWDRITNLVGSSTTDKLIEAHIGDCLMLVPHLDGRAIVDVGAGAGLPGIVIAIARPECSVILVERRGRKARFLTQTKIELGLENVTVVAERIENWRPDAAIDCVVCRGYSSLAGFYRDTQALHREGLKLCAMKGALNRAEIAELGLDDGAVEILPMKVPGWEHRHLVTISCPG